ncbi:MAG: dimethylargininase [Balneolaceae bacterium]|nr:MAG: dimethylargininase [Balneolaceae bacterium]
MPIALTREVCPLLENCELTHLSREPIDIHRAKEQHKRYEETLAKLGFTIRRLKETPHLPDGVFVEDTAVVFPEFAIITRPGAESRLGETESMAEVLKEYRELYYIREPGKLDGGDVLKSGETVYIGLSARSNLEGIQQFRDIVAPFGYNVSAIPVTGCLHLKSGITVLETDRLLINPEWVHPEYFADFSFEYIHPAEPYGANVIRYQHSVICTAAHPETQNLLQKSGYDVIVIDQSELAKAEAGLTCCSVLIEG